MARDVIECISKCKIEFLHKFFTSYFSFPPVLLLVFLSTNDVIRMMSSDAVSLKNTCILRYHMSDEILAMWRWLLTLSAPAPPRSPDCPQPSPSVSNVVFCPLPLNKIKSNDWWVDLWFHFPKKAGSYVVYISYSMNLKYPIKVRILQRIV